ncbi:MAG: S8 family serine peptidase [Caldilineaceae bacterium]
MEMLWFSGVTVVVSSGNNGDNEDAGIIYPPANDPFVITVGASDDEWTVDTKDDILAPYTAIGYTNDGFMKPEIIVPGSDIIAPLASDDANLAVNHPDHVVAGENGNLLLPHVGYADVGRYCRRYRGVVAQCRQKLTPDQVKYRLMNSGQAFSALSRVPNCELTLFDDDMTDGWQDWSSGMTAALKPTRYMTAAQRQQ